MYDPKIRAETLLADAVKGPAHARELFTSFGCHTFAFSRALKMNGEAVLMTQIYHPDWGIEKCTHAWCAVGGKCYDYFGEASSEELVLKRFLSQPGFSPPWKAGVRAHLVARFDSKSILSILAGDGKPPSVYYSAPEWLKRAVALADTIP